MLQYENTTDGNNAFLNVDNWIDEQKVESLDAQINGTTEYEYEEKSLIANKFLNTNSTPLSNAPSSTEMLGTYCAIINVTPGDKYIITGLGGSKYSRLYVTANSNRIAIRQSAENENSRITPKEITIEEGEVYLYVNLTRRAMTCGSISLNMTEFASIT